MDVLSFHSFLLVCLVAVQAYEGPCKKVSVQRRNGLCPIYTLEQCPDLIQLNRLDCCFHQRVPANVGVPCLLWECPATIPCSELKEGLTKPPDNNNNRPDNNNKSETVLITLSVAIPLCTFALFAGCLGFLSRKYRVNWSINRHKFRFNRKKDDVDLLPSSADPSPPPPSPAATSSLGENSDDEINAREEQLRAREEEVKTREEKLAEMELRYSLQQQKFADIILAIKKEKKELEELHALQWNEEDLRAAIVEKCALDDEVRRLRHEREDEAKLTAEAEWNEKVAERVAADMDWDEKVEARQRSVSEWKEQRQKEQEERSAIDLAWNQRSVRGEMDKYNDLQLKESANLIKRRDEELEELREELKKNDEANTKLRQEEKASYEELVKDRLREIEEKDAEIEGQRRELEELRELQYNKLALREQVDGGRLQFAQNEISVLKVSLSEALARTVDVPVLRAELKALHKEVEAHQTAKLVHDAQLQQLREEHEKDRIRSEADLSKEAEAHQATKSLHDALLKELNEERIRREAYVEDDRDLDKEEKEARQWALDLSGQNLTLTEEDALTAVSESDAESSEDIEPQEGVAEGQRKSTRPKKQPLRYQNYQAGEKERKSSRLTKQTEHYQA